MIAAIGSVTTLQEKPDEYAVRESDRVVQENAKTVEERPVEETENGSDSKLNSNENGKEKFLLKDNKMVFEKYNGSGEVILQIPPLHSNSV